MLLRLAILGARGPQQSLLSDRRTAVVRGVRQRGSKRVPDAQGSDQVLNPYGRAGMTSEAAQARFRPAGARRRRRRDGVDRVPPPARHARDRSSRPWRPVLVMEDTGLRHGLCGRACPAARDPREVGRARSTGSGDRRGETIAQ